MRDRERVTHFLLCLGKKDKIKGKKQRAFPFGWRIDGEGDKLSSYHTEGRGWGKKGNNASYIKKKKAANLRWHKSLIHLCNRREKKDKFHIPSRKKSSGEISFFCTNKRGNTTGLGGRVKNLLKGKVFFLLSRKKWKDKEKEKGGVWKEKGK